MAATTLGLTDAMTAWVRDNAVRESPTLQALREETAGLADVGHWAMPPEEGQVLALVAQVIGAKRIVELGTFTGYGALWMAEALTDVRIITCERFDRFAEIARRHWDGAGVADRIDLRMVDASVLLDDLEAETGPNSIDMIVIDADKKPYPDYYRKAVPLVRPGGLVLLDNAFRGGGVADPADRSKATQAIRDVTVMVRDDARVDMALLPVADGLIIARKR